ncbi:MAG: hypothetical protein HKO03_07300 [Acidimicrobiia bacterium]|nr:hypothetical protein [Acidimicrobiia bacterium]
MDGFPIFAFIFFAIAASTIAGLSKTRRQASLQKAADELGLRVDKKGLSGEINGYLVDTEYVSRGDKKGTRFRVRYPGWLGFDLRIATDQLGGLRKLPMFGNLMPAQDIEIGNDDLDTKHLIQGDTHQVTRWFNADRRDMVERASKRFSSISITDRHIETYIPRIISNPDELAKITRAVLFMAEVAYRTDEGDAIESPLSIPGDPFGDTPLHDPDNDEDLVEVTIVDMDPNSLDLDQVVTGSEDSVFAEVGEATVPPEHAVEISNGVTAANDLDESQLPPEVVAAEFPPALDMTPELDAAADANPDPRPDPPADVGSPEMKEPIDAGLTHSSFAGSVAELSESLFGEYQPAYRIEELFSEGPIGSTVTWSGNIENVGEFTRDRYLGDGPGIEVELTGATLDDGRVTEIFAALPIETDIEKLRSGAEITVRGTLTAVDAIMRRFYLTDGELLPDRS